MYHLIIMSLAVFTLEMGYLPEKGHPSDNSHQTDDTCTSKLHDLQVHVACLPVSKRPVY